MNYYVSIKIVHAEPMTRHQANKVLNRETETEVKEDVEGYLVAYTDGYKSWCPKKQFEKGNVKFTSPLKAFYKLFKLLFL